ncbi:MAG: J domain-containing protein [Acidimicrobiaceae bacterium]|nr:J domain-containing protein [Acidimicrobiaceae bacterium]
MKDADDRDRSTLYHRLDVPSDATSEQIARAYRRLAHSAHPDAHPDDPQAPTRFRELTEAYEVLIDPGRRAGYDRAQPGGGAPVGLSPDPRQPSRTTPPIQADPPSAIQLRVGPVHVQPGKDALIRQEASFDALADLIRDLMYRRWWR